MSSGFSWLPPSGWVDLFGGVKETVAMIEKAGLTAPAQLKGIKDKGKNLPRGRRQQISDRQVMKMVMASLSNHDPLRILKSPFERLRVT
jgi:hypothetical protein